MNEIAGHDADDGQFQGQMREAASGEHANPAGYRECATRFSAGAVCVVPGMSGSRLCGRLRAASIASSTRWSHPKRIRLGTSSISLRLRAGSIALVIPARIAARTFPFTPPIVSTKLRNEISRSSPYRSGRTSRLY